MAVPKRKTSKARIRTRRKAIRRPLPGVVVCTACGAPAQPHRVCRACGQYNGRQVMTVSVDD